MTQQEITNRFDVAIVGAGPAGAAAAIDAARSGLSVAIIERERFPRFHIGESLTGEAGKAIRDWGIEDQLNATKPVEKQGTYVIGGSNESFFIPVVGIADDGSTRVPSSTWQVERSAFDQVLLDCAIESGATHIRGAASEALLDDDVVVGVRVTQPDNDLGGLDVLARTTIDASGQSRFMAKQKLAGETKRGKYAAQVAFFTHLHGVDRSDAVQSTNTRIFYAGLNRWAWLIPVSDEVTSLGIVQSSSYFRSCDETPDEFVKREMLEMHGGLAELCREATVARPVESAHNFSYQVEDFSGPGWLAVGDAHRFIDPIFSLGVASAILEGREAAALCLSAVEKNLDPEEAHTQLFKPFEKWSDDGLDVVQTLIDAFWSNPFAFGYVAHRKHHDDIVDIFAGRYYGVDEPSEGLVAMRRLASAPVAV